MRSVVAIILGLVIIAAVFFYRSPQVRELVEPQKQTREDPLEFLDRAPPRQPAEEAPPEARPARRPRPVESPPSVDARQPAPPAEQGEQIPDEELSRVLLQILAARRLASGVSIMVDQETIEVNGEVDSPEKRREILTIINNGRGSRKLEAEGLVVRE